LHVLSHSNIDTLRSLGHSPQHEAKARHREQLNERHFQDSPSSSAPTKKIQKKKRPVIYGIP